ncbi:MAG: uracil phosphoribosyltransferase [Christensenellales bacterium]|jgi:uracil phosphoribosyltransferase|nr:uracil phosphoribosyltransferase [Clostridiales bacterium]
MQKFENVTIFNHPLISHKIALLRDKNTDTKHFRELVEEITALMAYEALKDVPTKKIVVETPLESCSQNVVVDDSIAIVPILRAGLGMVNGVHMLFPTAKVGHIGIYRDEESLLPNEYYCKLPENIKDKICIVLDPMLATGGSAKATIDILKKKYGCKKIKLMSIIAAPEGVDAVAKDHKDVKIFVSALDRQLNEKGYILPGLGDAGDRLFGTK